MKIDLETSIFSINVCKSNENWIKISAKHIHQLKKYKKLSNNSKETAVYYGTMYLNLILSKITNDYWIPLS